MTLKAKKTKLTFPDSGEEAYFVPHSLQAETMRIQRRYPIPKPPLVTVDYGNGHKGKEFNYADPGYDSTLEKWQQFIGLEAYNSTLRKILKEFALNEKQQKAVDAWKAENPDDWDGNDPDKNIWLEQIACSTNEDSKYFTKFVQDGGQPAYEEVTAIQDGFQSWI